jgi:RNA polymerase sigma factor (sigma-70 family)
LTNSEDSLRRAASGDVEAFAEFFDANAPAVLRFLQLRTAAADVAADLCAETFAAALTQLDSFDPERGSGSAWIHGIARNKHSNWLRSRRVEHRARRRLGIASPSEEVDDLDIIELRVDLARLVGALPAALSELSDGVREAVVLRIVDELPYATVAERLRCSEVAARVRVSRGLNTLLDVLGPSEEAR